MSFDYILWIIASLVFAMLCVFSYPYKHEIKSQSKKHYKSELEKRLDKLIIIYPWITDYSRSLSPEFAIRVTISIGEYSAVTCELEHRCHYMSDEQFVNMLFSGYNAMGYPYKLRMK